MARPVDPDPLEQAVRRELLLKQNKRYRLPPELTRPQIKRRPQTSDWAPLSFSQQRLWFLEQLDPGTSTYNLPILLQILGSLNQQVLTRSFQEAIRRHDVLRTVFRIGADEPVQVVLPHIEFALPTIDLTNLPAYKQETESSRLAQVLANLSFDLSRPPLIQGALLALGPSNHQLLLVMHHIISDGWSLGVLISEVRELYDAFLHGRPSPLPELPIQYTDFAVWQREWIGEVLETQLVWWHKYLADAPTLLELPTDRPRLRNQSFRGSSYRFSFGVPLTESMTAVARREGVTPFMLLLASWVILLGRHAGQDEVLVGTPVAGRNLPEVEGLIGFFVNTLVLRTYLDDTSNFIDLLRHVRESALDAYAHQDIPFERIVEELVLERTLGVSPLFQVMLVLQNTPTISLSLSGLALTRIPIDTRRAKFDLTLIVEESEERGFEGVLEYNTDLFDSSTAERLLERFRVLVEAAVVRPYCLITELPLLTEAERFQMEFVWNNTAPTPLAELSLYRRFKEQAALYPDELALIYGEQRLTFKEASLQAERLAARLVAKGVGPEVVVGLRLKLSPELVVAALAVLAVGGAYLPLTPSHPEERQAFILSDAGTRLVISAEVWPAVPAEVEVLVLPSKDDGRDQKVETIPLPEANPESLAYILYTSGSTGRPKGVMVQHRALVRYIDWAIQAYEVEAGQGTLVHSSLMYDLTVTSLWVPLLAGRTVTLLPEAQGGEALAATVRPGANFSLVKLTPSHLNLLAQQVSPDSVAGWARLLVVGGDVLQAESLAFWREHAPETRIINEYGPTETVVGCSVYEVKAGTVATGHLPIGRPIAGTRLYVLDRNLCPVPIGVVGELCIGGEGVTRGYLGNPSLTAERFVPDPFSTEPCTRMYKSGDLARWSSDGALEVLGRLDHQIKIRGFRIEPGEIETVLCQYPGVRNSVIIARSDIPGEAARLVAYIVGENLPDTGTLQAFLTKRLPNFMVPTAFVHLASLPLTRSGKVDKRALPQPDVARNREALVPPRTPIEERLAEIWAEVLHLDRIGIQDNFFNFGGHSLLAVRAMARVREVTGIDIPLRALFESPTIAELADQIASLQSETSSYTPDYTFLEPSDPIDAVYNEMIALVRRHGNRPGLREALHPLRERLQALQEIEARGIAEEYDSHFRPDYERVQTLLAQAQELLKK